MTAPNQRLLFPADLYPALPGTNGGEREEARELARSAHDAYLAQQAALEEIPLCRDVLGQPQPQDQGARLALLERLEVALGMARLADDDGRLSHREAAALERAEAAQREAGRLYWLLARLGLGQLPTDLRRYQRLQRAYGGDHAPEDQHQYALLSLLEAARRYDPEAGVLFSTYARHRVKKGLRQALERGGRTVSLPHSVAETLDKIRAVQEQAEKDRRPLSANEAAHEAGISTRRSREVRTAVRPLVSLDAPLTDDEEGPARDLADGGEEAAIERLDRERRLSALDVALAALPAQLREVLTLTEGLGGVERLSQKEIAAHLGVSTNDVARLQREARTALRVLLVSGGR